MSAKEPFEQLNELNKLTTEITKRTAEYMVGATNGFLNDAAKTWSELGNVKKMEDVIAAQTRIASEMGNKFLKNSQEALNVWQENSADIGKFVENCSRSMGGAMNPMNNPMNIMNPAKGGQSQSGKTL